MSAITDLPFRTVCEEFGAGLTITEFLSAHALIARDQKTHDKLTPSREGRPFGVQIFGRQIEPMIEGARMAVESGAALVDINMGCPAKRVIAGECGAALMREPDLAQRIVRAIRSAVPAPIPVTVKHRTGVDQQEDYDIFAGFAAVQIEAGAEALIVHARNAWLQGLSPKQNREIPPLKYDWVYRLKQDFPDQQIVVNGGIKTLDTCLEHLQRVDGVMLGREPYNNPYLLHDVDQVVFGCRRSAAPGRSEMLRRFYPYIEQQLELGTPLMRVARHLLGLFNGEPNARRWRRYLSENACRRAAGMEVLYRAEQLLDD